MKIKKYFVAALSVAVLGAVKAAETENFGGDRTADLEYLCTPAAVRWPNSDDARRVFDLEVFHDRVYVGSGEYGNNAGPCPMIGVDVYDGTCVREFTAGTEAAETLRTFSDGRLYVPATDHMDVGTNPNGFWFRKEFDGSWTSNRGIPNGVTGSMNIHNWDMQEFNGWIFSAGYGIAGSKDWGATWKDVCPEATLARRYTNCFVYASSSYWTSSWSTYEYRYVSFLEVGGQFFCLPKNRIYFDDYYYVLDNKKINEWNPPTIWRWDGSAEQFNCEFTTWDSLVPGLTPQDFALTWTNAAVQAKTGYLVTMPWHATKFKDRCLLVIGSGYNPAAASCIYLENGQLRATRVALPAGTYPYDVTVVDDAAYVLAFAYQSDTQMIRHGVWKSTDGVNFTEILSFEYPEVMQSIEYHQGYFYFGVSWKKALPNLGKLKSTAKENSGAVYRVWCPQEPVRVLTPSELRVTEGGTAELPIRLSAAPSAEVVVTVEPIGTADYSFDRSELTFTPLNWNVAQKVRVSLADNDADDTAVTPLVCGEKDASRVRGAFASAAVTPAVVSLIPEGNDFSPTVTNAVFSNACIPASYTATVTDFGTFNGVALTAAEMTLAVYTDTAKTQLVTSATVPAVKDAPVTVCVSNLEAAVVYTFVAEVRSAPTLAYVETHTVRAPVGTAAELVDLTDDLTHRAALYGNSQTGPADAGGAWDNQGTGGKMFGGYSKPSHAIYEFTEPAVVNAFGLLGPHNQLVDRQPLSFAIYGGSDTNNWVELGKWTQEPQWPIEGEWRRYSFANTNAYKFYRLSLTGAQGPNMPWVMAQEAELYHVGPGVAFPGEAAGGDPDPGSDPDPGTAPDPGVNPDPGTDPVTPVVDEKAVYVSPDGDDSAEGSFGAPFLTVSNAVAHLGDAGGKIVVMRGQYALGEGVLVSAPIEIAGETGNPADVVFSAKSPYGTMFIISNVASRVTGVTVTGASAKSNGTLGGAFRVTSGMVSNCVMTACNANRFSSSGGGVYATGADSLVTHCTIRDCSVGDENAWGGTKGAGVQLLNGARLENSLVVGCTATCSQSSVETHPRSVGGVYASGTSAIVNCTVVGNHGWAYGGIFADGDGVSVRNTVVADNTAKYYTATNTAYDAISQKGASTVENCSSGTGSVLFADAAAGNYTPMAGGALVDAGGSVLAPAVDLAGNARVCGAAIDIGCFEFQGAAAAGENAVTLTAEETQAGAVTVPYAWLTEKGYDCSTPEKAKAAATQMGANGYTVWASYVADLVPADPNSKLVATISIAADGQVTVDCEPKSAARTYRVLGKANLSDAEWTEKAAGHRFFKIGVSLP